MILLGQRKLGALHLEPRGRGWYHHSSGEGGTVIDFVYKYAPIY